MNYLLLLYFVIYSHLYISIYPVYDAINNSPFYICEIKSISRTMNRPSNLSAFYNHCLF